MPTGRLGRIRAMPMVNEVVLRGLPMELMERLLRSWTMSLGRGKPCLWGIAAAMRAVPMGG